jgi:hypothetical protein
MVAGALSLTSGHDALIERQGVVMSEAQLQQQVEKIMMRANQSPPIYLHRTIQLGVDSKMTGLDGIKDFNIGPVQIAGLNGWRITGVVPKTLGTVKNYGLNDFAGMGGNVIAVYVMMELEINERNASLLRAEIYNFLKNELMMKLT